MFFELLIEKLYRYLKGYETDSKEELIRQCEEVLDDY